MNDLDRKIAELKGWKIREEGDYMVIDTPPGTVKKQGLQEDPERLWWSTSDSKALELVDELEAAHGLPAIAFELGHLSETAGAKWYARFFHGSAVKYSTGHGPTRPEAICRAYIAAVTWMKEKGR